MSYIEPNVSYKKLEVAKHVILPAGVAEVAFVGRSLLHKTIIGEVVERGTGDEDTLSAVEVLGIIKIINQKTGHKYILDYDYSFEEPNIIKWLPDGNRPVTGDKYIVDYQVPKSDKDFDVKTTYSLDEVKALYGNPSYDNDLALAAEIFFLNGGVKLKLVQMETNDLEGFKKAYDKLSVEEVDVVVPLCDDSLGQSFFADVKANIYQLSQPTEGKERIAIVAAKDGTSIADYKGIASAMAYERIILVCPDGFYKTFGNESKLIPAYFACAALAGFLADPDHSVADPLTRKEIFGFNDVKTKFTKTQMRDLLGHGVLVIENFNNMLRVVHGVTTDIAAFDRNEISLVRIGDFFGKTCRAVLDRMYIGTKIEVGTMASIRTTIITILDNFIAKGIINSYTDFSVERNALNPTAIDVFLRIQPSFPLNYITVSFTLELL